MSKASSFLIALMAAFDVQLCVTCPRAYSETLIGVGNLTPTTPPDAPCGRQVGFAEKV